MIDKVRKEPSGEIIVAITAPGTVKEKSKFTEEQKTEVRQVVQEGVESQVNIEIEALLENLIQNLREELITIINQKIDFDMSSLQLGDGLGIDANGKLYVKTGAGIDIDGSNQVYSTLDEC